MGIMISCGESSDPGPEVTDKENTVLATSIQGGWVQIVDERKDSYNQINLKFDGKTLIWTDSSVTTEGKYAIVRNGECGVKYLKNDPEVVNKYLMGRPPLTSGVKDIVVSEWRGTTSTNRNYRNTGKNGAWELITSWESSGSQPPIPDAVYTLFIDDKSKVIFELDGQNIDYQGTFSKSK